MAIPSLMDIASLVRRVDEAEREALAAEEALGIAYHRRDEADRAHEQAKLELERAYNALAGGKAGSSQGGPSPRERFLQRMREAGVGVGVTVDELAAYVYGDTDSPARARVRSLAHTLKGANEIAIDPDRPGVYTLIAKGALPSHPVVVDPDADF